MIEKKYDSPRGTVAYWLYPNANQNAKWVFFLHGLSADHTLFDPQVSVFTCKYNMIVWDAPAHALSRPYRDFSYANCAEDMMNILSNEGVEKAIFIGQSMGGYCIQAFLLRYSDMAEAFIAIDSCPFGTQYYSKSDLFWLRQVGWMSRLYSHSYYVETIAKSVGVMPSTQENMRRALAYYSHPELCRLMGMGYLCFVKENQDLKISCPTLILVGEHDKTGKVLSYSKTWHAATEFPFEIIPNAAHNANYDNPDAVNTLIDSFLNAPQEE